VFPFPLSTATPVVSVPPLRDGEDAPKKGNIALGFGRENSVDMEDNQKPMPRTYHGGHHMVLNPSEAPIPLSPCTTAARSLDCGADGPMWLERRDKQYSGGDAAASTYDSSPTLFFHSNFRSPNSGSEMKRPVALRPSSQPPSNPPVFHFGSPKASEESSRERTFPSIRTTLDEETDVLQAPPPPVAASCRERERLPVNIPQLRIRSIRSRKELKMPSPLARRGAAERAYLQGQLKAEALRRRKQAQHNERRKLRDNATIIPADGVKDEDNSNKDILNMVEKFKFGLGLSKKKNSRQNLSEFASSPPPILKTTFKRSVSAVLADSGIHEDSNLLFFPDGVPLLNEEEESSLHELLVDATAIDLENLDRERCSLDDNDDGSVDESDTKSTSQDISEDEISPSLVAADVIWQLGALSCFDNPGDVNFPRNRGNKKVTLRPKMAPNNNATIERHSPRQFKPINSCVSPASISSSDVPSRNSVAQSNACNKRYGSFSVEERSQFKFATPDKFNQAPCIFSSPEAGINDQIYNGKNLPDMLKEPFNYKTPDNSEHNRTRRQLGQRMPKLPELRVSDMADSNSQQVLQGEATIAVEGEEKSFELVLKVPLPESNYCTPDHGSSRKKLDTRMPKLSGFNMIGSSNSNQVYDAKFGEEPFTPELQEVSGRLPKHPPSETSFFTPDNSEHSRRSSRSRKRIEGRMPKLPEFDMIRPSNANQIVSEGEASIALLNSTAVEEAFTPELFTASSTLLNQPLSESNFFTPDNSEHSRRSSHSRKKIDGRMPKLLEFNMIGSLNTNEVFDGNAPMEFLGAAAREESFTPELLAPSGVMLKQHLSESNFCTPDKSEHVRRSSHKQLVQRKKELSLPHMNMVDNS